MREVVNGPTASSLPEHLDHMYGLLLLREVSSGCRRHQVVGISLQMQGCLLTTDVHPESSQELEGTKAFVITL